MKKDDWVTGPAGACGTVFRLGKLRSVLKLGTDGPYVTLFNTQLKAATPGMIACKLQCDYADAEEILRKQNDTATA